MDECDCGCACEGMDMKELGELAKRIKDGIKEPSFINLAKLNLDVEDAQEKAQKVAMELNLEMAKKVLVAINTGKKLTQKEKNLIREIVVGDAERYVEAEENIEEKMDYLNRSSRKLAEASRNHEADPEAVAAMLWDINSALNTITGYFEAKERIERFNAAFSDLETPQQKAIIFEMMNARLGINLF